MARRTNTVKARPTVPAGRRAMTTSVATATISPSSNGFAVRVAAAPSPSAHTHQAPGCSHRWLIPGPCLHEDRQAQQSRDHGDPDRGDPGRGVWACRVARGIRDFQGHRPRAPEEVAGFVATGTESVLGASGRPGTARHRRSRPRHGSARDRPGVGRGWRQWRESGWGALQGLAGTFRGGEAVDPADQPAAVETQLATCCRTCRPLSVAGTITHDTARAGGCCPTGAMPAGP